MNLLQYEYEGATLIDKKVGVRNYWRSSKCNSSQITRQILMQEVFNSGTELRS